MKFLSSLSPFKPSYFPFLHNFSIVLSFPSLPLLSPINDHTRHLVNPRLLVTGYKERCWIWVIAYDIKICQKYYIFFFQSWIYFY